MVEANPAFEFLISKYSIDVRPYHELASSIYQLALQDAEEFSKMLKKTRYTNTSRSIRERIINFLSSFKKGTTENLVHFFYDFYISHSAFPGFYKHFNNSDIASSLVDGLHLEYYGNASQEAVRTIIEYFNNPGLNCFFSTFMEKENEANTNLFIFIAGMMGNKRMDGIEQFTLLKPFFEMILHSKKLIDEFLKDVLETVPPSILGDQESANIAKEEASAYDVKDDKETEKWECRICNRILENDDEICWSCRGDRKNVEKITFSEERIFQTIKRDLAGIKLGVEINVFCKDYPNAEELTDSWNVLSFEERIYSFEKDENTITCGFLFGKLYKIAITTSASKKEYYRNKYNEEYGPPDECKLFRTRFMWADENTTLYLSKRGPILNVILTDVNLLSQATTMRKDLTSM